MLYNKSNLVVAQVASKDEFDRGLNGVRFEPDGTTVAGNKRVMVAVEGVDESKVPYPDVGPRATPGDRGVVLEVDHVQEALSNIPRDKRPVLHHCAMTKGHADATMVELTTVNAGGRERRVSDRPKRDRYPNWKKVVRTVRGDDPVRVCVNRSDLIDLLKTLEAACPDKGNDCPVYLEIGQGIMARSHNRDTNQQAVGAINAYDTRGYWLEDNEFMRGVLGNDDEAVVPRPKRRLRR